MSDRKTKLSRRNFLLTVGAGGVGGAAAIVALKAPAPGTEPSADGKRGGQGYKLTRHIDNYYRTTKV